MATGKMLTLTPGDVAHMTHDENGNAREVHFNSADAARRAGFDPSQMAAMAPRPSIEAEMQSQIAALEQWKESPDVTPEQKAHIEETLAALRAGGMNAVKGAWENQANPAVPAPLTPIMAPQARPALPQPQMAAQPQQTGAVEKARYVIPLGEGVTAVIILASTGGEVTYDKLKRLIRHLKIEANLDDDNG